ncbi:MAG: DUF4381 domain-containing protein [Magnetococcales bacterium]|nr:DUF4381 domain-containing protein [Magnetococcales bacterium]
MNADDPLAGLRDLHAPPPIPLWPPAPGWWLLPGLLLLGVVLFIGHKRRQKRKRHDPHQAALRELDAIADRFQVDGDTSALATALSALLKRSAMIRHDRQAVASLNGEAWLRFLDATGACTTFSAGVGRVLASAPYRPGVRVEPEPLLATVRAWIEHDSKAASKPEKQ